MSTSSDPTSVFSQNLAVIIGIDAYSNGIPALRNAVNDASHLEKILHKDQGFTTLLFVNQQATRQALTTLFSLTLPALLHEGDRLLVYFAGHGVAMDGDDGPAGYLVPQDADSSQPASMLPMQEFHRLLDALPCRHLLLILDCCFAGAFRWAGTRHLLGLPTVLYRERYDRFVRDPAWQVLTSAADDQQAFDEAKRFAIRNDSGDHSPFALALFEALQGAADLKMRIGGAEPVGDGLITATELYAYLREWVETQTIAQNQRQTPGLWPLHKHGKGEFIFRVPGSTVALPSAPDLHINNNPYQGLNAFTQDDAELFFGRTALTGKLMQRVLAQPLLVVTGASGTGKSSLVKAGLLPRLARLAGWHLLPPLRPSAEPLAVLRQLTLPGDAAATLATRISAWREQQPTARLVLVIDQCEELITLCRHDDERKQFLQQVTDAVAEHPTHLRLILTVRTDFEPYFASGSVTSPLAIHWPAARFPVTPMTQDELRLAIVGPATVRMLNFEPETLIERIINDVVQMPGALPLLSFTLSELYLRYLQRADATRSLTEADYDAMGGVIGSLSQRATAEYDSLPDDAQRMTMQRVMLRMVAVEGGELARRRVPLAELAYPSALENRYVEAVIQRLVNARLLVHGRGDADGDETEDTYIEPAHDALVRAWDKLLIWKRTADEYLPLQRRLTQAANEWERAEGKAQDRLLWNNDPRLPQLQEELSNKRKHGDSEHAMLTYTKQLLFPSTQITTRSTWLNALETEFVRQSILRRSKGLWQIISITLMVIVILGLTATFALLQRNSALTERDRADKNAEAQATAAAEARQQQAIAEQEAAIARSRQRATQSSNELDKNHYELAVLLAIEAGLASDTLEAFGAIRRAIAYPWHSRLVLYNPFSGSATGVWSRDEQHILMRSASGAVSIRQATTGNEVARLIGHTDEVNQALWSRDGKRILTASQDGTVRIWETASGTELIQIQSHTAYSWATWNRAESRVLTSGCDKTDANHSCMQSSIRIWDAASGEELARAENHFVLISQATWNQDESRILTATCDEIDSYAQCMRGSARIWDAASGRELVHTHGQQAYVTQAIWNQQEDRFLTLENDGTVRIWNAQNGEMLVEVESNHEFIFRAIWSQDESRILTGSSDGTARIWDASSGKELIRMDGQAGEVSQAMWNQDESLVLTVMGEEGIVIVWDATSGNELVRMQGETGAVIEASWNQDESRILAYTPSGMIWIWDAASGIALVRLEGHTGNARQAMWSQDEQHILSGSTDGTVRIWDLQSGNEAISLKGHTDAIYQAVSSHDERRILTASNDGSARIWDVATGTELVRLADVTDRVFMAQWSQDERRVLTFDATGAVHIWDTASGTELVRMNDQRGGANQVTWSQDESRVLTTNQDGVVFIWDATTGKELTQLQQHGSSVNHAMLNKNGTHVLTAEQEGLARIWDATTGQELIRLEGITGRVWQAAWSADEERIVTASEDGAVRIWDAADGKEMVHFEFGATDYMEASWSPDEQRILVRSARGAVGIWNATNGQELARLNGHTGWAFQASWSRNGSHVLTASQDSTVRIWETASGKELVHLESHAATLTQATWSRDESRVLTSGCDVTDFEDNCIQGSARIWDATNGQELVRLEGHTGEVTQATWSQDERRIWTASLDGTVRIWYVHMADLLQAGCQWVPRNFTQAEWQQYMGGAYRPTCPDAPIPPDAIDRTYGDSLSPIAQARLIGQP